MRILMVGDLHLKANRLKDVAGAWEKTVSWARRNDVDLIAQAGDVFHKPNIFGREADVGTIFSAFFRPFRGYEGRRAFLVPGNHDMGGPRNNDALSAFDEHSWITVCHRPEVTEALPGLSVCAVPWVNRAKLTTRLIDKGMKTKEANKKAGEAIENLMAKLALDVQEHRERGNFVLFLGHVEVTGARRGGGDKQSGGLFEFSPTQLSSVGADAYALAHIHVRQPVPGLPNENDGYIGSLCQLDFGEEGNDTGFRYIDVEDGKVVADKFVDNKSSPRFFTVDSLEGLDYDPDKDYVKLRGETRPDRLPDRVKFEKVASQAATKRRVEEDLDSNTPIRRLLEAWRKEAKCEVPLDDMEEAAEAIRKRTDIPDEAIGSLDRIERIFLQNVTSHELTEIDLEGISGVHGIEGPNGSGKTTALEAFLIALYGHCPSRPSLQDVVRNRDGVKDSLIEVDFVSNGRKLTARREFHRTSKTFKHEAYLYQTSSGKKDPIAGPKVADVKECSSSLVGDLKMVLTGTFSAQSEMDNIVNLDRRDRMEMFAKLLGSDKFITMGKTAADESKGDNAVLDANRARIESIKLELASEPEDRKALDGWKAALSGKKDKKNAIAKDLKGREEELSRAAKVDDEIREKKKQIESHQQEQLRLKEEANTLLQEKQALASIDADAIKQKISKLHETKEKVDKARLKISEAKNKASEKTAQAATLRSQAEQARSRLRQQRSEALKKYADEVRAIEQERESKRAELQAKMDALILEINTAKSSLKEAKRQAELIKGFPDLDPCKECPLAVDGLQARKRAEDAGRSLKRLEERRQKGEQVIEKFDQDTGRLVGAVPKPPEDQGDDNEEAAELERKASELEQEAKGELPPDDFERKFEKAIAEVAELPRLEEELEKARNASSEADKIAERINYKKERFEELKKAISAIEVPEPIPTDECSKERDKLQGELRSVDDEIENAVLEVGRAEAKLAAHEKNRETLKSVQKEVRELEKSVAANNALAKAFSRDGIPQLIVDNTIPHFQEILSDLISEFDGRWSMQIQSQRETKKGSMQEVIDILVDDGYGLRDIKTYSGGEKQLLKTITRIAFATLQAERSGKGLKVLILDEATGAMDPELAEQFVQMLARLSDAFNQVFVVSHNDYVLTTLPNRIIFSLDDGITKTAMSNI